MARPDRRIPPSAWPSGIPLTLEGVHVWRGQTPILRGVDLQFLPDRRAILLGPSGSGKSTLLRLLNRLEDPASGRLRLGETPLTTLPVRQLRQEIAVVPQDPRPLPGTIRDNLRYPSEVAGRPAPADDALAAVLDQFGLPPGWLDRGVEGLSGGERRRLAIAVALQTSPEILALDEPTAGLDPAAARLLVEALNLRARRDRLRTIVVTHDRRFAPELGEDAFVLDAGRVVDQGPIAQVLRRVDAAIWKAAEGSPTDEDAR